MVGFSEDTNGYYSYKPIQMDHPEYQKSGFMEAQVVELGRVIAHFKGPFAKLNARKFFKLKCNEVNKLG